MANEKKNKNVKTANKASPGKPMNTAKSPKLKGLELRRQEEIPSPDTPDDISEPSSPEEEPEKADSEVIDWPKEHDLELFERIKKNIPKEDTMKYDSRVNHMNWEAIKFKEYSAETCKNRWVFVQGHLRHYRLLSEVVTDAVEWTDHPWTNFNKGSKNQKHPEQPKKPLSSYMLFYMEQRDSILQKQPGLGMTELSKVVAKMYNEMSDRKKAKYLEMAEREKEVYNQKMLKFIEDHPDLAVSKQFRLASTSKVVPPKLPTPFKLFCDAKMDKFLGEGLTPTEAREKCKNTFKELNDKQKLKWIYQAIEKEPEYQNELKAFVVQHPDYEFPAKKPSLLTKEELLIKQRNEGKPEKPPNSGYSLFSKTLLSSNALSDVNSKERMQEISRQWKELSESEKNIYNDKALQLQHEYRERLNIYLESLPPERRFIESKSLKRTGVLNTKDKVAPKKPRVEPEAVEAVADGDFTDDEADENQPVEIAEPKKSAIQKPKSSLQIFCDMNLQKYSAKHPNLSQQELSRLLAKEFVKLPAEQRKVYSKLAKKSKESPIKEITEPETKPKKAAAKKEAAQDTGKKVKPALTATAKTAKPAKSAKARQDLPAWAVNQRLYKDEPPKPPENVAEYYAYLNSAPSTVVTSSLAEDVWRKVPEKQKKKITAELKKKQQQYVVEFENFVRKLPTEALKDFRAIMKSREKEKKARESPEDDDDDENDDHDGASSVEDAESSGEEQIDSFSSDEDEKALSSSDED